MTETIVNPALIDVPLFKPGEHDGYPEHQQREDTRENMMGMVQEAGGTITAFSDKWWIDPKHWQEVSDYNDANGLWGFNYRDRFTNQSPTHECTCHSLVACAESARNRQYCLSMPFPIPGQKLEISSSAKSVSIWFSALSVYAEANPRKWGGAGVRQVLSIATRRGFLPDKIQPKEWGFKHHLIGTNGQGNVTQSRGDWVSVNDFPKGWQETAGLLKPIEYIFPASFEEHVCLLLHGLMIGVGRNGHAVPHGRWLNKQRLAAYLDSYDVVRYDSERTVRSTVGGSFAIVSFMTPDNWMKPAEHNLALAV